MKLVKEHIIFEKFTEDSDPIQDLGIGMISKIEKWLKDHNIINYTINHDLTIDLHNREQINIKLELNQFPNFIQFRNVKGYFYCFSNGMTSLKGCPETVDGDFICAQNLLKTLEGGPKIVTGKYYCHLNPILTSLKGCAEIVGNHFDCDGCDIQTLEYMPKKIGGHFNILKNPKKFTKKEIRNNCDIQGSVLINDGDE